MRVICKVKCLTPLSTILQIYRGDNFIGGGDKTVPRENHRPPASH